MVSAVNQSDVLLETSNLHKSFGAIRAVDGVSFAIQRGEAFGLLGPNGAGKTTTIGMMVGLLQPDSGEVTFADGMHSMTPKARRRIGIAPQALSLYEDLTAAENLAFFGRLYGLPPKKLRERIDWAIEFAGLNDRKKHRVKTYSGGMKRRLNFAAALVHEPEIVLLDEPTVGVDPQSRNHLFEAIEKLKADGLTIIYTTHYMEEAQRLCDRVAIIDHGKILEMDTVDALIDRHGGRSVVKGELRQMPPERVQLPGSLDELSLRFESNQPLEDIGRLVSEGVTFDTLQITRPDLETVFLTLTGRSLRDS